MMEFTFEQSPWEQEMDALRPGDSVTAVRCLTLLEELSEEEAEEALLSLVEKGVRLDIAELPMDSGNSEAALRLRQERDINASAIHFINIAFYFQGISENIYIRTKLSQFFNMIESFLKNVFNYETRSP